MKVDVNIFPRFFKFALQQTRYSLHLRKRFGIYLSPWHSYKHALLVLFRSKANFIWLRLWKAAFPSDKTCLVEPSTYQLCLFFNICMVAYSKVFEQIDQLAVHQRTEEVYASFRNIFEYFLPAIRDYIYYLRKGDYDNFLEQRKKLLILFMDADSNSLYVNGEILSCLVNIYSSCNCTDYIDLQRSNFMLVNEEVGEVSFSILARDEYKKGSKFKLDRANRSYKLIPLMRRLSMFYRRKAKTTSEKYRYKNPNPSSPQIARCVEVFESIMNELENGEWKNMSPVVSKYAYQMSKVGLRSVTTFPKPFPKSNPSSLLDIKLSKFIEGLTVKIQESSDDLKFFLNEIGHRY